MLTTKDIKNLSEYLKTVFVTQESFDYGMEVIQKNFLRLEQLMDSFAKDNKESGQAMPVINYRVKEVENWIDKASPKLGIKFDH